LSQGDKKYAFDSLFFIALPHWAASPIFQASGTLHGCAQGLFGGFLPR